jgi:hypothetical protein
MGLGTPEIIIIIVSLLILSAAVVGWVLWKVLKRNDRVSELESRLERLERQLGRTSEPTAPKRRD